MLIRADMPLNMVLYELNLCMYRQIEKNNNKIGVITLQDILHWKGWALWSKMLKTLALSDTLILSFMMQVKCSI